MQSFHLGKLDTITGSVNFLLRSLMSVCWLVGRREAWIVGWRGGVWAEQQFPFQLGDFFLSLMDLSEVQARCSQLLQPVQRTDICLRSLMFSLQVVQV